MKGLFDFIASNYLWILLGLVVIFFAYMGYSAEKKGYIGKGKKKDDELVDIDELIKPKDEKKAKETAKDVNKEEDLSESFDVMPEVSKEEVKDKKQEEDISEDLYAPFGDKEVEMPKQEEVKNVDEVEENNFNQDFVDLAKIESEAKDINNNEDKKDVADLMKSDMSMPMDFEVEGASSDVKSDNIFDKVAAEDKKTKKKKSEEVDDMWKF